jgi:hypothetical protein
MEANSMNDIRMYQILEQSGFSKENALALIAELKNQDSNLATKGDAKLAVAAIDALLEKQTIEISNQIYKVNSQSWRIVGVIAFLAIVFRVIEKMLLH